jgi:transposase
MAGKTKPMSQIKQLLNFHKQGKKIKTIARILDISKNTVKSYLKKLEGFQTPSTGKSWTIDELVKLESPVLEMKFHSGNPSYKEERYEDFKSRISYLHKELKRVGVTKHLLWQEYRKQISQGYGYSQFCYHLQQQKVASKPSMVMEHLPGDKLYIDFAGKKLNYIDKETGELIECEVFVACLPYSDYVFAMAVHRQTTEDFLYALSCCLQEICGVPKALVPDNLKAAVIKVDRYEPTINRALEDFANHYDTTVVPARAYKPKDKALVENQVKLIYSRVYAKLRDIQFFDIDTLNEAIKEKVKDHNQTRMQQKPYCREERFLAQEKDLLGSLPKEKHEIKYYRELTVAVNNHIQFFDEKHYYSVPYHLIGQKVKVIYTRTMVYVYHKGESVATHIRSYSYGYTSVEDHLCSHHKHYKNRSPDYYKQRALKESAVMHRLIGLIFSQGRHPEQVYRTCDGMFSLYRQSDKECFEKACDMAIAHENYTYIFVRNVLENNMTDQEKDTVEEKKRPAHDNLRGKRYYQGTIT